jgi:hypothetical protein
MIYRFDKKTLTFKNVFASWVFFVTILCTTLVAVVIGIIRVNDVSFISEETKAIILRESDKANEFSPEKLKAYVLELNIRFPYIVYAQAQLETGEFKSKIFKENNNLFGLKQAKRRPTTNKGEENGHAYYNSWKDSVVDYAFYSAQYLSHIKTEDECFQYLSQNYAEDPNYVVKLKKIIAKSNIDK